MPEDTEGAEISEEILESGKVTKKKLERWLKCRKGASTTGTKSVLLKRFVKFILPLTIYVYIAKFTTSSVAEYIFILTSRVKCYIKNGWDTDLTDPDRGKNIARKEKQLTPAITFPTNLEMWTNLGSQTNYTIRNFSLCNLTNYFINRRLEDRLVKDFKNVNKHLYGLFKAGHIQNVKVLKTDMSNDSVYIKCICLPEMKNTKEYGIQLVLPAKESDIQYARCGCPSPPW